MSNSDFNRTGSASFRMSHEAVPLLSLTAVWIALVLIVDPRGDFPLMDDWSYGRSVKILVEEGRLTYDGWNAPTLTLQVLYGALFCIPFGFSFEALRTAALVAGLAGGLASYAVLREVSVGRTGAATGSLAVMLSPSYFQHAFSFMTDVPFAALAVIAAFFYIRALKTGSVRHVVVGTVLAACSVLVRQIGLAIPMAYAVALVINNGLNWRTVLQSSATCLFVVLVLILHGRVIDHLNLTPAMADAFHVSIAAQIEVKGWTGLFRDGFKLAEASFAHLSLLAFPFAVLRFTHVLPSKQCHGPSRRLVYGALLLLLLLVIWRFWPPALPIRVLGMAHNVMHGVQPWSYVSEPALFRWTVWGVEFVATLAVLGLAAWVVDSWRSKRRLPDRFRLGAALFGATAAILVIAPFALAGGFFERYLIPAVPFAILALAGLGEARPSETKGLLRGSVAVVSGVLLAGLGLVSVLFAHDYLAINRARWEAVGYLVRERGIEPALIDGGLSVNGWYLFTTSKQLRERYVNWKAERGAWWRNLEADYVIGIGRAEWTRLPGQLEWNGKQVRAELIAVFSYDAWLPGVDDHVVICNGGGCGGFFWLRHAEAVSRKATEGRAR